MRGSSQLLCNKCIAVIWSTTTGPLCACVIPLPWLNAVACAWGLTTYLPLRGGADTTLKL